MKALPLTINEKVKPKYLTGFKIDNEVHLFYFNDMEAYNYLQQCFELTKLKK